MNKNSQFRSERLLMRGITKEDADDIVRWRSDPANYNLFFNRQPITKGEHLEWFNRYLSDMTRFDFMIIDSNNRSIGTITLSSIDSDSCEIGYLIGDVNSRGQGFATEAVGFMASVAVTYLSVSRVIARIQPENVASIKTAKAAGFIRVGDRYIFQKEKQ